MDFKQIETFLQVVKCQNMTKAADILYITQSTASYRLKTLEAELGTVLVERKRGTQNVSLTENGRNFIRIAEKWLDVYNETQEFCFNAKQATVRMVAPESINYFQRDMYKRIRDTRSDINISILTANSDQIADMIKQNKVDVGFSYIAPADKGIESVEAGSYPLVIIERGEKRASYPNIETKDLDIEKAIIIKGIGLDNPNTAKLFRSWFNKEYYSNMQLDSLEMIDSNMADGEWCLIPALRLERLQFSGDVNVYSFIDDVSELPYYRLRNKDTDRHMAKLLNELFD